MDKKSLDYRTRMRNGRISACYMYSCGNGIGLCSTGKETCGSRRIFTNMTHLFTWHVFVIRVYCFSEQYFRAAIHTVLLHVCFYSI